jgi:tetratricopeptide (TPR) repeat protein
MGLQTPTTLHFGRALEQARYAGELSLVAKVLYCIARTRLQAGKAIEALRLLSLGQIAAQESGHPIAVALIAANEALVYGTLGDCRDAEDALLRARGRLGEFGRGRFVPPWLILMDEAELSSLAGATYAGLSNRDQLATAVGSLQRSLALRHSRLVRSRTLDTILLADVLFALGDAEVGARIAKQALDLAEHVRSSRVDGRLDGLRKAAVIHSDHPDVSELVERLDALQT